HRQGTAARGIKRRAKLACWSQRAYGDFQKAQLRGKMQRGIAIVREVWILKSVWTLFGNAFDEYQIIEMDGPPEANGYGDVGGKWNVWDVGNGTLHVL
ncbi:MAG: hypothetical protein Q9177_000261, partial [Variospora cf. flavescens]